MLYSTKGEFLQDLRDYKIVKNKLVEVRKEIKKLEYLRYEKVKSPTDYEVIGYDENEETVRQLKTRGYISPEQIAEKNEKLDNKIKDLKDVEKLLKNRIQKTKKMLSKINPQLREMVIDRYINGMKYDKIREKYSDIFVGQSYVMQVARYLSSELDNYF